MFNNEIIGRIPLVDNDGLQHEIVLKVIANVADGEFYVYPLFDGEIMTVSATVEDDGSVTIAAS